MNSARSHRSLIAWTLYVCVLFSAFACSIGHGQMTGLQLSGLGGAYCAVAGQAGASADDGLAMPAAGIPGSGAECALCALFGLSLALLLCRFGLRRAHRSRLPRELRRKASPRYTWPAANPRASPWLA